MRWYVVSPPFDHEEYVDYFLVDRYEVRDVAEVEARTAREARQLALNHKDFQNWVRIARGDGVNPMVGVEVKPICPACETVYEEGVDNWDCPVCGDWHRSKTKPNGWEWEYFDSGERYTTRYKAARIRKYEELTKT